MTNLPVVRWMKRSRLRTGNLPSDITKESNLEASSEPDASAAVLSSSSAFSSSEPASVEAGSAGSCACSEPGAARPSNRMSPSKATSAFREPGIRVSGRETFKLRAILTHPSIVGFMVLPLSLIGWIETSLSRRSRILRTGWIQLEATALTSSVPRLGETQVIASLRK